MKKYILLSFLALEICVFCFYYGWGDHGFKAVLRLKHENAATVAKIDRLHTEVDALNVRISDLKAYPWYKEKIAREELQLAYPDEEIILL